MNTNTNAANVLSNDDFLAATVQESLEAIRLITIDELSMVGGGTDIPIFG